MQKQDISRARTAQDLERRYGKSFAEAFDIATDARTAAEEAKQAAAGIDENLTQEEIFKRLTNNGEDQGLYLKNGKVYVNAQYILSGSFTSTAEVFLEPGLEEFEAIKAHLLGTAIIPSDKMALYDFDNNGDVTITDALKCRQAMLGQISLAEWSGAVKSTVTVTLDASAATRAMKITGTNMWGREIEIYLGIDGANIGVLHGNLAVGGKFSVGGALLFDTNASNEPTLAIGTTGVPKTISWKDNGDGTFTLIGR